MISSAVPILENDTTMRQSTCERSTVRQRICLMGASFETDNLGVNALTRGALTATLTQYPNAELRILEYGIDSPTYDFRIGDRSVPIETLNIRFSKNPLLPNHIAHLIALALVIKVVSFQRVQNAVLSRNAWLAELSKVDLALAIGGGDSFSDIYGLVRFFYVCLPQILLLLLGKRLVLLPQTIGPFKSRLCERVARCVLSHAAAVYSRDQESVAKVRKLLPSDCAGRVRFGFDVGFAVPAVPPLKCEPSLEQVFVRRPVIGMNISGLLYVGGYTHANMFGLASDYKRVVHDLARVFLRECGATVLLIPHVFGDVEGDLSACQEICDDLRGSFPGRISVLKPPYDECEGKYVIGQCDFFVGSRMHSCIAALSQCVPAAALAYSGKFRGVLQSIGMDSAVVDLRTLSRDEVIANVSSLYESRHALRADLEGRMPEVKRGVLELFQDIALS